MALNVGTRTSCFHENKSLARTFHCGNRADRVALVAQAPCAAAADPAPWADGLSNAMDEMTLDTWVPFRDESPRVRCRLFLFPHAAGSAAFYQPLRRCMPSEIDLCPVELPGRAARVDEPPCTRMSALMEELRHVLPP